MIEIKPRIWMGPAALALLTVTTLSADTLILRNGRRLRGELVSVRDGRLEFEEDSGRRLRYDVQDVDRVEFGAGRFFWRRAGISWGWEKWLSSRA